MVRSSMMEVVINQHRIFLIKMFHMKVLNIYIYEGSENPLLITRVYSTKWLCSYDMLFYPFDTQVETDSIQTVLLLSWHQLSPANLTCCFPRAELLNDVDTLWQLSSPGIHSVDPILCNYLL